MKTQICLMLAAGVLLGACSSDDTSSDETVATTTTTQAEAPADSTTTTTAVEAAAETTTTEATTTTTEAPAAAGEADDCLIGTWTLDNQSFADAMLQGMAELGTDVPFTSIDPTGTYTITAAADGTWTSEKNDWGWIVDLADGQITTLSNGIDTGTYTVEDGRFASTFTESGTTTVVTGTVGGQEVTMTADMLPEGIDTEALASQGAVPFDCDGDTMSLTAENGFGTTWARS